MGCASSKQKRCDHCQRPYSPVRRSYSMHVHHPPQGHGDSYHVVALKSSTIGSLKLDSSYQNIPVEEKIDRNGIDHHHHPHVRSNRNANGYVCDEKDNRIKEFSLGLIEAKTWSNMINERIPKVVPKTPIRTPPGEPETINTWELMEGLEDVSPFRSPTRFRSFSFDVSKSTPINDPFDRPKSRLQENGCASPKSIWVQVGDDNINSDSLVSEFDPEVISSFRKSLEELSPDNPFHLRPLESVQQINGTVSDYDESPQSCKVKQKEKIIVYFTSLRGVRKTYEDCCHVKVILRSIGVRVDERDVSMHSGFKDELKGRLGEGFNGGLPRVFLGEKYIGGADEIRKLNEDGQLEKLLESCEKLDEDGMSGGGGGVCEGCGDIRFVPCETCSGSCKVYYEVDHDEEEEEEEKEGEQSEEGEYGFQRCPDCNENGLIRCPLCCY